MTEFHPRQTPWQIDEADFYEIEDRQEQIRFLLRYAVLAPSSHNAQPWTFRITDEGVEVLADAGRRLPFADPHDRELRLGLGAALANLRVAAAHFGYETSVLYQPRAEESLPVALVAMRETSSPDRELARLFPSIARRHTNRQPFQPKAIEEDALSSICDFIEQYGDIIRFVVPHDRARIAELVADGDRQLLSHDSYRNELADWMRPNESSAADGMCGDGFGIPGPLSALGPWMVRRIDFGGSIAEHDRSLAESAAGIVVITSEDDTPSLVRAGEVLEYFLLLLTSHGIQYSFLNQPVEVDGLRGQLWSMLRSSRPPQLILRIGYARPVAKAMPRRPVDSVVGD
jgi:hypothetical protein